MYIVFDIGGTKMRVGYSINGAQLAQIETVPTPSDFHTAMETFERLARKVSGGAPIKVAAGGVPGPLSPDRSRLLAAPNLPLWAHQPLKQRLAEILLTNDIFLENDTALVGLGEAHRGAGQGSDIVAYLSISTGFGGVRIVRGRVDVRRIGFEPGHQILNTLWPLDPTQAPTDLESYFSGAALKRKYGQRPEEIVDPNVWEESMRWLALGVHNTAVYWSPDVVVLGGALMNHNLMDIDKVAQYLRDLMVIFPTVPLIKKASLNDMGGLQGALVYITQQLTRTAYG